MVEVITRGTGKKAQLKGYTVFGKTGTAQVARLGKVRLKTHEMSYFERDHAWFTAFAPVESPEIAVVVLNALDFHEKEQEAGKAPRHPVTNRYAVIAGLMVAGAGAMPRHRAIRAGRRPIHRCRSRARSPFRSPAAIP